MDRQEYIVEAMNDNGRFVVVGKWIAPNNLLNDYDLEEIWDCANHGVNSKEKTIVNDGMYKGMDAFVCGDSTYVIVNHEIGVVNDNIMVRKHYDVNTGYYIKSSRVHKDLNRDLWCFGTREEIMSEYHSNPFIVRR